MHSDARNFAAAVALGGYFLTHAAAVALFALCAGVVLLVALPAGSIGNPDGPEWFALGSAVLICGFVTGILSAWAAYRNRAIHLTAIGLGAAAAILGCTFGAGFLTAADSAKSLGDGVFYSIFGPVFWTLAASGAAAMLSGALGLVLEWLRNAAASES